MNRKKVSFLLVLPSILIFILIEMVPILVSFIYSFTNWNGYDWNAKYVGFANYVKLITDTGTLSSIKISLYFVFITVAATNILALILAVILKDSGIQANFYRSALFLPVVISPVAAAYIWKVLFSYDGLLDYIFKGIGLAEKHIGWLENPDIALYSVCLVAVWKSVGLHIVILLASIKTIPGELYEAADIDGCASWQKFLNITLPLIRPGLTISIVLSTIGNLKQYPLVSVLTDGGPVDSTQILSIKIIHEGFRFNQNGFASAISFLLFTLIMLVTLIQNTLLNRKKVEY